MNSRSGWFRGDAWDENARAVFDEKIARVPAGRMRARCFWLKANALFYGGRRSATRRRDAIALLERALVDAQARDRDLAELLDHLGRFRLLLGQREAGIAALRACVDLGGPAFLKNPDTETLLARRVREEGDHELARRLYDLSLPPDVQWGGKSSYAVLVARNVPARFGPVERAHAFVQYCRAFGRVGGVAVELGDYDLLSFAEIDRVFRCERDLVRPFGPLRHSPEFLESTLIPDLGAYVGEVLCRQYDGRWQSASPLMQSRVLVGSRLIDPFAISYETVYYEESLEEQVRAAIG